MKLTSPPLPGFVNTIKITGEDQVMLKVRVVEVQREVLKQFGVDLQALLSVGKFAFNLASITQVGGGILRSPRIRVTRAVYTDGANSITGCHPRDGARWSLENLAEPNLTAVSGQPAKFHAGGEVPMSSLHGQQRRSNMIHAA